MSVVELSTAYIEGQLTITRLTETRFRLEGNYMVGGAIAEALEIAAHSNDRFKATFAAFRDEYLKLTEDWAD